jgi:hypothetical protein
VADWDDVRRIASALPGSVESTHYRDPAYKVDDRAFVTLTSRFENAIVIRCTLDEQQLLIRARPDVYFITPHYEGWAGVVMRLAPADEEELAGALEDSYAFVKALPPKRKRPRQPAAGAGRRSARSRRRPS